MRGRTIPYSEAELAWIKARCEMPRRDLHAAFVAEFGRSDVSCMHIKALCKRRGWHTGRTGQFEKGQTPPYKGRKGFCPAGSEKGWFRPGERQGRANQVHKPIGFERMSEGGYLERKVNEDLPFRKRWRAVHILNWEAANGPIPRGHALKCLDGNRLNVAPSNWAPVPRAMLPRLAGAKKGINYDTAAPELRPVLMAAAQLDHAIREKRSDG